jgi:DNA-binding transcriptional ArsR family regulator
MQFDFMRSRDKQTQAALRALAEPCRVDILRVIRSHELAAGEISRHFKTTRSAISQHLRVLTHAGLLAERRHGTSRLYRIRPEGFGRLRDLIGSFWDVKLDQMKLEVEKEARTRSGR